MNPERWGRIKQVHQSAIEVEPGRRDEYLREACAGDESLLKEVTSLLEQDGDPHGLESPALEVVAQALGGDQAHRRHDLAGRTLLHYFILENLKRDLASSRHAVQAPRKSLPRAATPVLVLAAIFAVIAG